MVEAAVDVGALDVEKPVRAVDPGHRHQDAHRDRRGLAAVAGEHRAVAAGQFDGPGHVRGEHRRPV